MKDITKYLLWFIFLCTLGFLFRGTYIMLYPFKPLVVHEIKIIDDDNTIVAGDPLFYSVHYTKYMPLTAKVHRRLVNSYIIPLPDIESTNAVGEGTVKMSIPIPEFADSGTYTLYISYEYVVGEHPERQVIVDAVSPSFRIVQKPSMFSKTNAKEIAYMKEQIKRDEQIIRRHREKSNYDPLR